LNRKAFASDLRKPIPAQSSKTTAVSRFKLLPLEGFGETDPLQNARGRQDGWDSNVYCWRAPGKQIICKLQRIAKADRTQTLTAGRFWGELHCKNDRPLNVRAFGHADLSRAGGHASQPQALRGLWHRKNTVHKPSQQSPAKVALHFGLCYRVL
jgi:hypothetical protein